MIVKEPVTIYVTAEHHVAQARQAAKTLADCMGFRTSAAYYIATSVSELANNLFFHAHSGGVIILTAIRRNSDVGMEVVAEDNGPGIKDVERAMQDDFSTNGGLGGGLPGVERMMDEFEISSAVDIGTRVTAKKWILCR